MKKNEIIVVFSSHLGIEKNNEFINHINQTIGVEHQTVVYENYNQYSLSEIYNQAIHDLLKPNIVFVFCHNDIHFKTQNWGKVLLDIFNKKNFQIIGVAGSTYLHNNGIWWHDRSKMYGVVEHGNGVSTWISEYSKPRKNFVKPVTVIDGLFMAIDCNNIIHRFDEDFKGFHFYDLPMVFNNVLDGYNAGVTTDIRIFHESVGMTNEKWEENRKLFIKKFKDELPFSIDDYIK